MSEDILEAIAAMPDAEAATAAAIVEEMEEEGRRTLELTPGAREFAEWLARQGIPTALVTRNTRATIDHLHATLWKGLPPFSPAISRDDAYEPKPHPAALEAILKTWEIADPAEVVMVGDSPANDVVFGKKAGVATALVDSGRRFTEGGSDEGADVVGVFCCTSGRRYDTARQHGGADAGHAGLPRRADGRRADGSHLVLGGQAAWRRLCHRDGLRLTLDHGHALYGKCGESGECGEFGGYECVVVSLVSMGVRW